MSEVLKRLGATTVTANTDTLLYAVPASKSAVVSTILVCNRGATSQTYRVAHVDGAIVNVANEDFIAYDQTIPANTSFGLSFGVTMAATHTILVRSDSTNVNFIAWGSEIT